MEEFRNFELRWSKYFWAINKHDNEFRIRIEFIETINSIFNKNFVFFIGFNTFFDLSQNFEIYNEKKKLKQNSYDEILIESKYLNNFLDLYNKNIFNISNISVCRFKKNIYFLEYKNRFIKIKFVKLPLYFGKLNTFNIKSNKYNYPSGVTNFLYRKFSLEYFEYLIKKLNSFAMSFKNKQSTIENFEICEISLKNFLKLNIEHKNSFNWQMRKPHLDLVTNNGKARKIKQIINFIKKSNLLLDFEDSVIETNTLNTFSEPLNINKKFWKSGNNFFIYPILFQFKKNVVPYSKVNNYIKTQNFPPVYSFEYYKQLDDMRDDEIRKFLNDEYIEITNNSITSGRHRVFAMIGRLVEGKEYIPFKAIMKKGT